MILSLFQQMNPGLRGAERLLKPHSCPLAELQPERGPPDSEAHALLHDTTLGFPTEALERPQRGQGALPGIRRR